MVTMNMLSFGRSVAFWASESDVYEIRYDEIYGDLEIYIKDGAKLKAGSTVKMTVRFDWEGDYGTYEQSLRDASIKGLKTTVITLSIKDASGTVKPIR